MVKLKSKTIFSCQQCGAQYSKRQSYCNDCEQQNSLVDEVFIKTSEETKGWIVGASSATGSRLKSIF